MHESFSLRDFWLSGARDCEIRRYRRFYAEPPRWRFPIFHNDFCPPAGIRQIFLGFADEFQLR